MWKSQVDFSTAGKELTPTMKMARHAILKKYANEVIKMMMRGDNGDGSRGMILMIASRRGEDGDSW